MPVKRRIVKSRRGPITHDHIAFLVRGQNYFYKQAELFPDGDDQIRDAWLACRADVLELMSAKPSTGSYLPGTRPWGFWKFDQGGDVPSFQYRELEELGLIDEAERREVVAMAESQWARQIRSYRPEWQEVCKKVSVESLLAWWPSMPSIENDGTIVDPLTGEVIQRIDTMKYRTIREFERRTNERNV
jgi:hypothetical protein